MPMRLVYVHGWGLDADFWTPLRQRLSIMDDFAVDLGFTQPPRLRIPYADQPYVAVGHSLGLLWLLTQTDHHPWQAVISINGFSRFTNDAGFPNGWPGRVVTRMIAALDNDPEAVYRDFMVRAGGKNPKTDSLKVPALKSGLEQLMECDGRAVLSGIEAPVLALAGGTDAIVSEAMTKDCFQPDHIHMKPDGDHLLPVTATDWCANEMENFLAGLT